MKIHGCMVASQNFTLWNTNPLSELEHFWPCGSPWWASPSPLPALVRLTQFLTGAAFTLLEKGCFSCSGLCCSICCNLLMKFITKNCLVQTNQQEECVNDCTIAREEGAGRRCHGCKECPWNKQQFFNITNLHMAETKQRWKRKVPLTPGQLLHTCIQMLLFFSWDPTFQVNMSVRWSHSMSMSMLCMYPSHSFNLRKFHSQKCVNFDQRIYWCTEFRFSLLWWQLLNTKIEQISGSAKSPLCNEQLAWLYAIDFSCSARIQLKEAKQRRKAGVRNGTGKTCFLLFFRNFHSLVQMSALTWTPFFDDVFSQLRDNCRDHCLSGGFVCLWGGGNRKSEIWKFIQTFMDFLCQFFTSSRFSDLWVSGPAPTHKWKCFWTFSIFWISELPDVYDTHAVDIPFESRVSSGLAPFTKLTALETNCWVWRQLKIIMHLTHPEPTWSSGNSLLAPMQRGSTFLQLCQLDDNFAPPSFGFVFILLIATIFVLSGCDGICLLLVISLKCLRMADRAGGQPDPSARTTLTSSALSTNLCETAVDPSQPSQALHPSSTRVRPTVAILKRSMTDPLHVYE